MTFVFPLLDRPLTFRENRIQVLIIEEPAALREFLEELERQIAGDTGRIVLGENYVPLELSRSALLLTDPLHPETESRKLATKILQSASRAAEAHEDRILRIMGEINALAEELSLELDFTAAYTALEDPAALLKLMDFHPDRESMELPELLLEWMRLQRLFFGDRLYILYGLKALLTDSELQSFYRSVCYEKYDLLLIEAYQRESQFPEEEVTIIDKDLCVIQ